MYSDLFNTIFVHIPKTGGQSFETVFLGRHGLTWQTRRKLLMRKNRERREPARLAHLYAAEYTGQGFISPERFAACFKFATVRNPYERTLSEFRYRAMKRGISLPGLVDLIVNCPTDRHLAPQSNFVLDGNGKILVDTLLRFESLNAGFYEVSREIFGEAVELPHVNASGGASASATLDQNMRDTIYRCYERDFDLFGYPSGQAYHVIPPVAAESSMRDGSRPD